MKLRRAHKLLIGDYEVSDIVRIETNQRMSRAVGYGGLIFVGGQVADDRSQDIKGQTEQVLAKLDGYLEKMGVDKSRILTAQIWLKDIAHDFTGMNEIWDAWVAEGFAPARATVQAQLGTTDMLVEIAITAAAK
ncbi:enamine deaminase RidA (YjgF/YER057c/UK114 family) [Pseudomonas sp. WPR_5_2]|uniref:RidA family protein n=1 Tax=Pseudomonas sp. WPR_5_2 TaxID=1907371 RepID=UPI000F2C20B9|nr:RidA family protein [Pseudomonas sp. WPR_5_2]RKS18956.1 enamine deaminase RidA (YjgF/YER057c/UK114 family) [Pseudomonas sp. WPR_5_2]